GRIAYFEAIGQLDPKSATPMSKDAIFRLYSMTKPFTSVAAMMLVEEGRLRLTDPVGMYLPQLGKLEVLTPSTDASGKTKDTTFHVKGGQVKRLAQPLETDRATGKPITLLDVTAAQKNDAGGAGAAGTALDYARFSQMLANGGKLDGQRLLARTIVRHMTSDHLGDIKPAHLLAPGYGFGLGFAVRRADGLNGAPGSAGEFNWAGACARGTEAEDDGGPHIGPLLAWQPLTEGDDRLGSAAIPKGHGGRPRDVAVIRPQPLRDEGHGVVGAQAEEARERLRQDAGLVVTPQREEAQEESDVGTAAGHESADASRSGGGLGI